MVVSSPLKRLAISWGKRGIEGVPLDSHDENKNEATFIPLNVTLFKAICIEKHALIVQGGPLLVTNVAID